MLLVFSWPGLEGAFYLFIASSFILKCSCFNWKGIDQRKLKRDTSIVNTCLARLASVIGRPKNCSAATLK